MRKILSPSILAADFWILGEQIAAVEREHVSYLHIDVMDGTFVPSISFGIPVIETIRPHTKLFFDVHLMITEPERYVEEFAKAGADLIDFHVESTQDPAEVIRKIRACGKKVGITFKPATPVSAILPYLEQVDMVLVMTVEPGFGGQKLIPECLEKVRELRRICDGRGLPTDIEVDGGITRENLREAMDAGANVIVAGSAVFKGDVQDNLRALCPLFD
ncbi:MAG: ribulose-phosphate 3-epimerase [Lachnospiraceae bacterium]|nr:ribulose-phosphate 3-epimerase [Lachnospiraceae bacterium]